MAGDADKYAELTIGLVGLLSDNLLSHPFIVLRRVCQVIECGTSLCIVHFYCLPRVIEIYFQFNYI